MLEVEICQMKMKNPTLLAAGVLGSTASSLNWAARSGVGAVVTKSIGLEPNKGYANPTIIDVEGGIINAIGLSNPGVENFRDELTHLDGTVPIIASIYGSNPEEFSKIASRIERLVDAIELNVSCPHSMKGCGSYIGQNPDLTMEIVKNVKKTVKIPVIVKLTPNVTDISEIAKSAEHGGCDALTLINSLGPGMRIELETAKPVLSNRYGGMSGPAIKPVALRCVYQIYNEVKVPLMGVGGITNYADAVEFIYAGASCVQIGTAVMYRGLDVFREICTGIERFMKHKGYTSVEEMVGLAHE